MFSQIGTTIEGLSQIQFKFFFFFSDWGFLFWRAFVFVHQLFGAKAVQVGRQGPVDVFQPETKRAGRYFLKRIHSLLGRTHVSFNF